MGHRGAGAPIAGAVLDPLLGLVKHATFVEQVWFDALMPQASASG